MRVECPSSPSLLTAISLSISRLYSKLFDITRIFEIKIICLELSGRFFTTETTEGTETTEEIFFYCSVVSVPSVVQ